MYHCGIIGWVFYQFLLERHRWQNTPSSLTHTQGGGEEGAYQREVSGQNIAPQWLDTALMQAAFLTEEMEADTEYAWRRRLDKNNGIHPCVVRDVASILIRDSDLCKEGAKGANMTFWK